MEGEIKALDREMLIKATKTLAYLIPIVGISNRIYIKIYGPYEMKFSGFVNFAEGHMSNLVTAFLIFSGLFLVLYFIEQHLLPFLFIATNKGNLKIESDEKERIGNGYKKIYGLNLLKHVEEPFFRFEMISDIVFLFIIPILWLIYWNSILGYILLVILSIVFFAVAKVTVILFEPERISSTNNIDKSEVNIIEENKESK